MRTILRKSKILEISLKDKIEYMYQNIRIGNQILFSVKAPSDGYLVVLYQRSIGVIDLIYPQRLTENNFVFNEEEMKICIKTKGPPSKQIVMFFFTPMDLIREKNIDLNDQDSAVLYMRNVLEIPENKCWELNYEFKVYH